MVLGIVLFYFLWLVVFPLLLIGIIVFLKSIYDNTKNEELKAFLSVFGVIFIIVSALVSLVLSKKK